MYALANVEKFLRDKASEVGGRAEAILERAKRRCEDGVFSGEAVEEIMGDNTLAREFRTTADNDPEHIQIGIAAIQHATLYP